MKIPIVTNLFPSPLEVTRGTFNFQQFKYLNRLAEVHVFVLVPFSKWLTNRKQLRKTTHYDGLRVNYVCQWYVPRYLRHLNGLLCYWSLNGPMRKILSDPDVEFIYSTWCYPDGWASGKLARKNKLRHYLKVHGSDINIIANLPGLTSKTKESLLNTEKIFSVSNDLKSKIEHLGIPSNKIFTLYNGISRDVFTLKDKKECRKQLKLSESAKLILYIGNLKVSKGAALLINAFSRIQTTGADFQLLLIGDGPDRELLYSLVEQLHLKDKITFMGAIEHSDISTWIGGSDIVCLPSFNEGVPNIILESLACGRPVVATNVGGIPEVVPGSGGILVPPGDEEALAQAILEAFGNEWVPEKICDDAPIYSWEENVSMLLEQFGTNLVNITRE